jgi:uncharacterized protein YifE (UPF0438 family)
MNTDDLNEKLSYFIIDYLKAKGYDLNALDVDQLEPSYTEESDWFNIVSNVEEYLNDIIKNKFNEVEK